MAADRCDVLCLDIPLAESLRASRLSEPLAGELAGAAKALSDPTRLTIAHALRSSELCVCDLAWVTERSDALVSHHVRALRDAGLVQSRRDGKLVMYSITPTGARLLDAVLAVSTVPAQ